MVPAHIRRRARERVVQFLYGWEFTREAPDDALEAFWGITSAKPAVRRYADKVIYYYLVNQAEIDRDIGAVIENWRPQRVGCIERAVIRTAYTEMRFMPDVPPTVAINEALEVTKRFGAEDAGAFVNGVLDRLRQSALPQDAGD